MRRTSWLLALAACTPSQPIDLAERGLHDGDPDWRRVPVTKGCDVYVANKPAEVGWQVRWKPCGDLPGCQELDPSGEFAGRDVMGGMTALGPHVVVSGSVTQPTWIERFTLAPLDGPPMVVIDVTRRDSCGLDRVQFNGFSAAARLLVFGEPEFDRLYLAGPLQDDPLWSQPAAKIQEHNASAVNPAFSLTGRTIVEECGLLKLCRSDPDTGAVGAPYSASGACCGVAFRDATIFGANGKLLVGRSPDAPPETLFTATAKEAERMHLQVDGDRLYWASLGPLGVELWTAPLTDDPAKFAARKIADTELDAMPGELGHHRRDGEPLVLGAGKVAYRFQGGDDGRMWLAVVDAATTTRVLWEPPAHVEVARPWFVSDTEVGVHLQALDEAGHGRTLRLRLDALRDGGSAMGHRSRLALLREEDAARTARLLAEAEAAVAARDAERRPGKQRR